MAYLLSVNVRGAKACVYELYQVGTRPYQYVCRVHELEVCLVAMTERINVGTLWRSRDGDRHARWELGPTVDAEGTTPRGPLMRRFQSLPATRVPFDAPDMTLPIAQEPTVLPLPSTVPRYLLSRRR